MRTRTEAELRLDQRLQHPRRTLEMLAADARRKSAYERALTQLKGDLSNGRIQAIGIVEQGFEKPQLEALPHDEVLGAFYGDLEDRIQTREKTYRNVRVCDASMWAKGDVISRGSKPKPGRKPTEGIEIAILACASSDPGFWNRTREVQCDQVRKYIFSNRLPLDDIPKGYKDGVIKRHLREMGPS